MHKQLLQEEHIETTTVAYDDGTEWVLDFYLQSFECPGGGDVYGIKVSRSTVDGVLTESDKTFAITESRAEALSMVKSFAKGKVLPISLIEVVDDWEWQEDRQPMLV